MPQAHRAPLLNVDIPIDLPIAMPDKTEPLVIIIDNKNQIYIQKSLTPFAKLGNCLMTITHRNPQTSLYIRADRKIAYGNVMKITYMLDIICRIYYY